MKYGNSTTSAELFIETLEKEGALAYQYGISELIDKNLEEIRNLIKEKGINIKEEDFILKGRFSFKIFSSGGDLVISLLKNEIKNFNIEPI